MNVFSIERITANSLDRFNESHVIIVNVCIVGRHETHDDDDTGKSNG